jgi:hypothetical protein
MLNEEILKDASLGYFHPDFTQGSCIKNEGFTHISPMESGA